MARGADQNFGMGQMTGVTSNIQLGQTSGQTSKHKSPFQIQCQVQKLLHQEEEF